LLDHNLKLNEEMTALMTHDRVSTIAEHLAKAFFFERSVEPR
jgi:hypothetical protein